MGHKLIYAVFILAAAIWLESCSGRQESSGAVPRAPEFTHVPAPPIHAQYLEQAPTKVPLGGVTSPLLEQKSQ